MFEGSGNGFFVGLGLIALGAGGIKPLVASFMGDQFDQSSKHLAEVVFDAFYWIINFGSLFASLLIPLALKNLGPSWAFGIPGILMFVATLVFWLGHRRYVLVPFCCRKIRMAWARWCALRCLRTRLGRAVPA